MASIANSNINIDPANIAWGATTAQVVNNAWYGVSTTPSVGQWTNYASIYNGLGTATIPAYQTTKPKAARVITADELYDGVSGLLHTIKALKSGTY